MSFLQKNNGGVWIEEDRLPEPLRLEADNVQPEILNWNKPNTDGSESVGCNQQPLRSSRIEIFLNSMILPVLNFQVLFGGSNIQKIKAAVTEKVVSSFENPRVMFFKLSSGLFDLTRSCQAISYSTSIRIHM